MCLQSNSFPSATFYVQQLPVASIKPLLHRPHQSFPVPKAHSNHAATSPRCAASSSPCSLTAPAWVHSVSTSIYTARLFFFSHPIWSCGWENTKTTPLGLPIDGTSCAWPTHVYKCVCEFRVRLCETLKKWLKIVNIQDTDCQMSPWSIGYHRHEQRLG